MAQDNPMYAGIPNPNLIRRELLLGTKDIIGSMKSFEQLLILREQKQAVFMDLKRTTEEIIVLNRRLKNAIPKAPIKMVPVKEEKRPEPLPSPLTKAERSMERVERPAIKPVHNIDILEQELAKIEAELKGLE